MSAASCADSECSAAIFWPASLDTPASTSAVTRSISGLSCPGMLDRRSARSKASASASLADRTAAAACVAVAAAASAAAAA